MFNGRNLFALTIAALFFYIVSPLILPVVMGAILAVLFTPWLVRMEARMSTALASLLLTLGLTGMVLMPAAFVILNGAKAAFVQLQSLRSAPMSGDLDLVESVLAGPHVQTAVRWVTEFFPVTQLELVETTRDLMRSVGIRLADLLGQSLAALPGMTVALGVIVLSFFFFLLDGRQFVVYFKRRSFLAEDETERLIMSMGGICRSVILASVIAGAAQAVVEVFFCVVTLTPNAALIGVLVLMGSFIPVIGSAPITFGVAVQQLLAGRTAVGIILLVVAVLVMTLDNFIRPLFLRGSANLHPLLALVAAFGGVQTLGPLGVFIGPVIAAVFIATMEIFLKRQTS